MYQNNFNKLISRQNTYSAKWCNSNANVIPLSVADMDIPAPDFIINALAQFNLKGIYGYTDLSHDWNNVAVNWFKTQYQWVVEPESIVFCPRIIQAVSFYIQNFTRVGDKVTTLSPAYYPISNAVCVNQRELLESPLIYRDGYYEIDFDDLESKFKQSVCFILLSPHNPTGTVWQKSDLLKIAELAQKYQVFIISDDVHADFVFDGATYHPISSINSYVKQHSFICTSPAKTFNLAGLEVANIVIANPEYREKFKQCLIAAGIHNPGYFSVPAFLQAYTLQGQQWVGELKTYLADNRHWVKEQCERYFPDWVITQSHGTYMLWINYQKMQLSEEQLKHWFVSLAEVEMSWGRGFGAVGDGFFRINIATPRSILETVFTRLIRTLPHASLE
ncbi:MalY/PatB family protein [Proteus terrae]|uniref:MalY/PatB family protein n=1 Tax=Proteus terrae TaxID=1574161 RepID=UPI00207C6512|nr:MalY/PatB family protein [Proteus terrae]MCO4179295.1 pyridoxal phosphate-dependent aminotransferase [Proteus terrae]MCO4188902.1 pyridoxal phosphate-dependent aminotransferase [Proteus terrae]UXA36002.1 pyridoxal phosphate-dependent aminotransferase [Proteus terrae]